MNTYTVGTNTPIKLKASIASPAVAFTYVGLNDLERPGKFVKDIRFETTPNGRGKQLNDGKSLKDRSARIRTMLDFFDTTDDEAAFDILVTEAATSYKLMLSGGVPDTQNLNFQTDANFKYRSALLSCEVTFK